MKKLSALEISFSRGQCTTKVAPKRSPFNFSGYIDSYYFRNSNNPELEKEVGQSGNERAFNPREKPIGIGFNTSQIWVVFQ